MQFYTADESSRIAYHTMKKNITKANDGKMKFQKKLFSWKDSFGNVLC